MVDFLTDLIVIPVVSIAFGIFNAIKSIFRAIVNIFFLSVLLAILIASILNSTYIVSVIFALLSIASIVSISIKRSTISIDKPDCEPINTQVDFVVEEIEQPEQAEYDTEQEEKEIREEITRKIEARKEREREKQEQKKKALALKEKEMQKRYNDIYWSMHSQSTKDNDDMREEYERMMNK